MSDMDRQAATRGYKTEIRHEEDGSWSLLVPAMPGLAAVGETFEEAWDDLPEVIDLWIESAQASGMPIPAPDDNRDDDFSGRFALRMPKVLHAALARCAEAEGTSINTFCVMSLTHAVAYGAIHEPRVARQGFIRQFFEPTFVSNRFEAGPQSTIPKGAQTLLLLSDVPGGRGQVSNAH